MIDLICFSFIFINTVQITSIGLVSCTFGEDVATMTEWLKEPPFPDQKKIFFQYRDFYVYRCFEVPSIKCDKN